MDFKFPRQLKLANADDFKKVFANPNRTGDALLVLLYCENNLTHPRLGLAVSKKHIRTAVKRNKVKRVIREFFRTEQSTKKGLDIVVLSRPGLASAHNSQIRFSLRKLWTRLDKKCVD